MVDKETPATGEEATQKEDLTTNTSTTEQDLLDAATGAITGGTGTERPDVYVTSLPEATAWLREEIGTNNLDHLYRQHGGLVRVHQDSIDLMDTDHLEAELNYRYRPLKVKDDIATPAMFPTPACKQAIKAAYMLPHAQEIKTVIETPVFRVDGTLLETEGYDPTTKLLYRPKHPVQLTVPEQPTKDDIASAVNTLFWPIQHFPFTHDTHANNWLGLVLTPLLSEICPPPYKLGLITANQQGSGKTYLADIIRTLYGGPFHASTPKTDEEFNKLITSDLTTTTGLAPLFDNLNGTLKGEQLAALLTNATWSGRILGRTQTIETPNNRLWLATGNNLTVDDDMARRCVPIHIQTTDEHPENRMFDFNPLRWVEHHRTEYLSAACTLIRAWVNNGGLHKPVEGSGDIYHVWRTTVTEILTHAGIDGGFDAPSVRPGQGEEAEELENLMDVINTKFSPGIQWNSGEIRQLMNNGEIQQEDIPEKITKDRSGDYDGRKVSKYLKENVNKPRGGYMITYLYGKKDKGRAWFTVKKTE